MAYPSLVLRRLLETLSPEMMFYWTNTEVPSQGLPARGKQPEGRGFCQHFAALISQPLLQTTTGSHAGLLGGSGRKQSLLQTHSNDWAAFILQKILLFLPLLPTFLHLSPHPASSFPS